MATSRRVGNYAQSANAVVRASDKIFNAAMAAKPDFTAISKEAIKGRSLERRAAMEAEGRVAQAGINAQAKVKGYQIAADAKKDVEKIKRPARRMAGIVGALGTLSGVAVLAKSNKENKAAAEKRAAETRSRFETLTNKMDSMTDNFKPEPYQTIEPMDGSSLVPVNTDPFTPPGTGDTLTNTSQTNSGGNVATNYQAPDGASTGMQYMDILVKDGFTPYQAAAITGQMDYESDGFRAMEEYTKNDYGTKGYGHLQWTNTPGSPRRDQFTSWVDSQQLEHSSVQANAGYLLHEMKNVPGIWTGGGSYDGMRGTKDLNSASDFMQFNYIRPKKATQNTPERRRRAQNYYDLYMQQNQ